MQYSDDRSHMRVEITAKECSIPQDEMARVQSFLAPLGDAVRDFPNSDLCINVVHHPRSANYNVEARLKVPGKTIFSSDQDTYLDTALQRCVRKLVQKVGLYRENPNAAAQEQARKRDTLNNNIVAPENPADGPLGKAVEAGDYRGFRTALSGYEEWLRKRVGRWVQRYPAAEAQIGDGLLIGDLIEEVYLNAFEHWGGRPKDISLTNWLDGLIDPSLKLLLKHPDQERENVNLARTLRETPL